MLNNAYSPRLSPHTFSLRRRELLMLSVAAAITPISAFAATDADLKAGSQNSKKRVFITGSSSGIGLLAAQILSAQGHDVVVHGRNKQRANDAMQQAPQAIASVYGDFGSLQQVRDLADQVNQLGPFDAVIHNAGIWSQSQKRLSDDGYPLIFAVNALAPYALSALIDRPKRLIYISSSMAQRVDGGACLDDILWEKRPWSGYQAYSESKYLDSLLAFAIVNRWQAVYTNTVDPGWVPTKIGGAGAPDDLHAGAYSQSFLAASDAPEARVSGYRFYHMAHQNPNPDVRNKDYQARFLARCAQLTDIAMPA